MAKKKIPKTANKKPAKSDIEHEAEEPSITVTYDLFELPTAQHKAGLAGLLLQIRHMQSKSPQPSAIPRIVDLSTTSATITLTEKSIQCLFDDAYGAENVEVKVKARWANATEVRPSEVAVEEVDGKPKNVRYYFYEIVQPAGAVLQQYLQNAPDSWLKLWRDMLWNIPRGNPQSRQPFQQRAENKSCKEGTDAWADLLKVEKARSNNEFHTDEVAGSLWLGAQKSNAEDIAFKGRVEQTLLLHFWFWTVSTYVPQILQPDGTSEFTGYVLAIPEVADLPQFLDDYPQILAKLRGEMRGYRPAEAVIDIAAEGALSFLEHLAQVSGHIASESKVKYSISSIEFLHLDKVGNNVKTLTSGRIVPRANLLDQYYRIVGRTGEKPPYGNPLFRRGLLLAMLEEIPWYQPFAKIFAEWKHKFFVRSDSPPKLLWFWQDSRSKLSNLEKEYGDAMKTEPEIVPAEDRLAILIHRIARTYLSSRAAKKSGIDPDKFKENDKIVWAKVPEDFRKALGDIGESLFLEFRSRRDQAFIDHFAQTFFAVKQYVTADQYVEVSNALINQPENVKTLTLMALSANS